MKEEKERGGKRKEIKCVTKICLQYAKPATWVSWEHPEQQ